ncbi:MAG: 50S ribosomal protein L32e [Candidatus Methanomethylicus sp.]|nr:50S ribosomal protein L32e [Candidatus Methanomethylicus sp.]
MAKSSPSKIKRALKQKEKIASERPEFKRSETHRFTRLGEKWRSSKGIRSKMRLKKRSRSAIVETGYRSPVAVRGMRMNGKTEVMVYQVSDLKNIDRKTQIARISATVGAKKRSEIIKTADAQRILIVNLRPSEMPAAQPEEKTEEEGTAETKEEESENNESEDDDSNKNEKEGERK